MPSSDSSPRPEPHEWLNAATARSLIRDALAAPQPQLTPGPWSPLSCEEVADSFPKYEILEILGAGGMGAVYKGLEIALDRLVALKLLPPELAGVTGFSERFRREAWVLARLEHSNIVRLYDVGTTAEAQLYFVMEYLPGGDLRTLIATSRQESGLKKGPALSCQRSLEIVTQVCAALATAHANGIVHRDIKPANVLLTDDGQVKLVDFGLARAVNQSDELSQVTRTGQVLGTRDYMAPEVLEGDASDHRADLYAVGVLLYELLTGEMPRVAFVPPSSRVPVDRRLDQIVRKALDTDPGKRFDSADALAHALQPVLRKASQPPRPPRLAKALFLGGAGLAAIGAGWRFHNLPTTRPSLPNGMFYYEPFDYPVGENGLAEHGGFTKSYPKDPATTDIIAGSLHYTDATGNQLLTAGNAADLDAAEEHATISDSTALALPSPSPQVLWISFIGQQTTGTGENFFNLCLWAPGGTSFPPDSNPYSDEIISVGMPSGSSEQVWQLWDRSTGQLHSQKSISQISTLQPTFVLVKLAANIDGTPLERGTLWLNPRLDITPPEADGLSYTADSSDLTELNQITVLRLGAGLRRPNSPASSWKVDEIRIGPTWSSVTPHQSGVKH